MTPVEALQRWKLLNLVRWAELDPNVRTALIGRSDPRVLLELCDHGALDGGLSVALDVEPDELIGPLCVRMGGTAARLKVEDVRGGEVLELVVSLGGREHLVEARRMPELVDALNSLFDEDRSARYVAVLGEWQDMLQLWAVPKPRLQSLGAQPWFAPENAGAHLAHTRDE